MAAPRAAGIILMMFDDDDFFALLEQSDDAPPADDEDGIYEVTEQHLQKRGFRFIGNDRSRRVHARPRPTP
jgi:hypothetical protein